VNTVRCFWGVICTSFSLFSVAMSLDPNIVRTLVDRVKKKGGMAGSVVSICMSMRHRSEYRPVARGGITDEKVCENGAKSGARLFDRFTWLP